MCAGKKELDQTILEGAIGQWRDRLHACVHADGAHHGDISST